MLHLLYQNRFSAKNVIHNDGTLSNTKKKKNSVENMSYCGKRLRRNSVHPIDTVIYANISPSIRVSTKKSANDLPRVISKLRGENQVEQPKIGRGRPFMTSSRFLPRYTKTDF